MFNFDSLVNSLQYYLEIKDLEKLFELRAKFAAQRDLRDKNMEDIDDVFNRLGTFHQLLGFALGAGIYALANMCHELYFMIMRVEERRLLDGIPITWKPLLTAQESAKILSIKPYSGPNPAGNERHTMLAIIAKKNKGIK